MGESAQDVLRRLGCRKLLLPLLTDWTTSYRTKKHSIIWATDAYAALGYDQKAEITPDALFTPPFQLMGRAEKARETQSRRTRAHAEVFTPLWIVRKMNDFIAADWFGYDDPFAAERVRFPKRKKWQRFVDSRCLEITCGEAPFLVTRYDVTTGEAIELNERVGLLDRKLRVVFENTQSEDEALKWLFRAFEATYGYELQGDNLLLARLNLLLSFEEYMQSYLSRRPTDEEYKRLVKIITYNIWQMDGLTGAVPYSAVPIDDPQLSMFPLLDEAAPFDTQIRMTAGQPCRIHDWRRDHSLTFNDLKRGEMK